MKGEKPTTADVRAFKARHGLTAATMAAPMYGITKKSVENWTGGHRDCPALAWWALVLHFDGIDLSNLQCPDCRALTKAEVTGP